MVKIRVYELARELKMESKALLTKMKQLGITVPSHQSTLTAAQIEKIRASKEGDRPKVILRRGKKDSAEAPVSEKGPEMGGEETELEPDMVESAAPVAEPVVEEVETPSEESIAKAPEPEVVVVQVQEAIVPEPAVEKPAAPPIVSEKKDEKPIEPAFDKGIEASATYQSIRARKKAADSATATIVRKATPEEMEATRVAGTLKAKGRREESRVAPSGPVHRERTERPGGPIGSSGPSTTAASSATSEERGSSVRWGAKERPRNAADRAAEEEEERRVIRAAAKRRMLSTRDILEEAVREEDDEEPVVEAPAPRKRTVYTPSGSQKRREFKRRRDNKATPITTPRASYRVVRMEQPTIVVAELARQLSVKAAEVMQKLIAQGVMVNINQSVDFDTASLIAHEYNFECKLVSKTLEDILKAEADTALETFTRPPIVTVMGHVDHGKTSILDAIRKSNKAASEAGGITQHIGAYTVEHNGFKITFLDTPGHEAFSAMRSRGAQLTDIIVLVVAADDGVMSQTVEAIRHAKDAGVPIIVAVNKVDKGQVNFDRIYKELSEHGVQAEDWGGEVQFVKVSALKNIGIDSLLEAIQIQAEILELQVPIAGRAKGTVIESHLDKGMGAVATIVVTAGTLRLGDFIVAGTVTGRVRAMTDHNGKKVETAAPSTPVAIVGLTSVPLAGDSLNCVEDEKMGREVSDLITAQRKALQIKPAGTTLMDLLNKPAPVPQVPLLLKADTQGSAEAVAEAIGKLVSAKVKTVIVFKGVGDISENDMNLAETSKATILGFSVRGARGLTEQAEKRGVVVKTFDIIYELIDFVKELMVKKLPPVVSEVFQGRAEVRDTISVPKVGVVAGSSVIDGKIMRNSLLRLIRQESIIFQGKVASLRRFKDDVKEVQYGYECGISIEGFNDIKVGDLIEAYRIEEKPATLDI